MRWKIGKYEFSENNQSLREGDKLVALEPLLAEALAYFCRHPNELIRREQLIEAVWDSRVITDNAISRVIAKLRKVLDDDPKAPTYIATYPKKGYRFIAPVQSLGTDPADPVPARPRRHFLTGVIALSAVCLLVLLVLSVYPDDNYSPFPYRIEALTRGGGNEAAPAVSPDGRFLAYSEFINGQMRLFLKELETGRVNEIGGADGWSGPASWSDDGSLLAYLYTSDNSCQYYLLGINGLEVSNRKLVHNCPAGSAGKIVISHDNQSLIFAERENRTAPYSIFQFDLITQSTRRLPQPNLVLGGNSQFDLHPTRNTLLISSPNEQQWMDFYQLDLDSGRLEYLFEQQQYICCAIWSHMGDRVVVMGEYPAHELLSFDLSGHDRRVEFQVPQRLNIYSRFPNQRDFVFEAGNVDHDIYAIHVPEETTGVSASLVINTSVDDRLGRISPDGNILAYISEQSGTDEIWLHDFSTSTNSKLTAFKDNRYYFDLQWSPDARHILAMTINELHLIDIYDGTSRRLKISLGEIQGISWKDNDTISYSARSNAQGIQSEWRLKNYNILTDELIEVDTDLPFVFHTYAKEEQHTLWFDRSGKAYLGVSRQPLDIAPGIFFYRRSFNIAIQNNFLYFVRHQGDLMQLVQWHIGTREQNILFEGYDISGLSAGNGRLLFSVQAGTDTDIYRTVFQ